MQLGEILRLFIPPIHYKLKHRRCVKRMKNIHPLPQWDHKGKRMVIIGNGPSLNQSMDLYEKQIQEADTMMVNFSARTPLFERIRPKFYVMSDPGWMSDKLAISDSMKQCVSDIIEKTQWPMTIVLPVAFRGWSAIEQFKTNPNLTVLFDESRWIDLPEDELFIGFEKNLLGPPACTVLTYCLYLALYWKYEETYLIGADTTFTEMVYIGQKDNVLYTIDRHFYNNDEVCPREKDIEKHGRKYGTDMEGYLEMCHTIFKEYNMMARYAKKMGLKVYNASEYSMIDCFERKKLK